MRVITGSARGAKLSALEGLDVRPTADRVKEAVFNIIQFEIEGRNILDLFAGSGQLGIEALSRGAASATFIDQNRDAIELIKQNLVHTKLFEKASVSHGDFQSFLTHSKHIFDIAFIDPPYSKGLIEASLPLVAPLMSENGVIVCEAAKKDPMPEAADEFKLVSTYSYGKTAVGIYRKEEKDS